MNSNTEIRLATKADSASILNIYAPFITDTVITFEYEVPTMSEFTERMTNVQKKYPWLVCEIDDKIVGYAYASQFAERAAFKWSVDFSIYIDPVYQKRKIGRALYFSLFELLKLQGYYNAYAKITSPNIKSENLHKSMGFQPVGIYKNIAFKFGSWHDLICYSLKLMDYPKDVKETKSIDEIAITDRFHQILKKAEEIIETFENK
ncbi:GNAT family N-acetyltransferase [Clostridium arbusti]|uniref:GNAT family N-acetyltransferase n=1 Tax=Clostridium arbusti TaxID=1137848 RepID=UPI00028A2861|nr:GNAT family N-acetyltransferase [Clostridium arbusti]